MYQSRQKLLRYYDKSVANIFEKENQLIAELQANKLTQCLLLWQANEPTLVLPAGNKWQETESLKLALTHQHLSCHWQLLSRKTGGAPVPQCPGVINLSHLYVWSEEKPYSVKQAYENLCEVLTIFFSKLGLESKTHATEFSYCDGDYNINLQGKKIVGTAQRVIIKKGGGKIVLAQAFILIDVLLEELIKPVNLCYELCGVDERVKAQVHTTLFDNINECPSIEELYQLLTQAFIDSKLYG